MRGRDESWSPSPATTLLLAGLVLVFIPGPAIVVLGLAMAVFAAEFTWARRWLERL